MKIIKTIFMLSILNGLPFFLSTLHSIPVYTDKNTDPVIVIKPNNGQWQPLEELEAEIKINYDKIRVIDGNGNCYFEIRETNPIRFVIGGALGLQTIQAFNKKGELKGEAYFKVSARTEIKDEGGKYEQLLNTLYWTMVGEWGETEIWRVNDKFYYTFVRWLRDHVHTLKGMKYFYPELKSGIDLYAETQRPDGMIWDNIYPRDNEKNWWNRRFDYGNFIMPIEDGKYELKRIPIENDVEYLFLEGLYYTWKATGDDSWMMTWLDQAIKAVYYSISDPYRWSEKYQLLKRGFTIDTWDFQSSEDAALVDGNDIMRIELGKTRFGIMYGDNTGMAAGCRYLSEMLNHAGRNNEAERFAVLGAQIQERIDKLSWNGQFYTHHIPEDATVKRDLGVDQSLQVSLSNAYSLNRNISHDKAVGVIKTYQRIREEMPSTSPGEWYTIFPPFEKGYGTFDSSGKWQYMNGGVTPIVAGELAHGAFEHGFESYGVDILNRISNLAAQTGNYLHCTYAGKMPEKPSRNFTPLSLHSYFNTTYPSKGAEFDGRWLGYKDPEDRSVAKIYHDIPFVIADPAQNSLTAIELSDTKGKLSSVLLPVNQKASSIYLLHGTQKTGLVGQVVINYKNGSAHTEYIDESRIGFWWIDNNEVERNNPDAKKAWRSNNQFYEAAYILGINNPHPDDTIQSIRLSGMKNGLLWEVMALTISDYPVFFEPSMISYGIPDNWGSAAVVYALIEGLAGIKDTGVAFDHANLSPRWAVSDVKNVSVTAKYEASGGYVSYRYKMDEEKNTIHITFTGSCTSMDFRALIPEGKIVTGLLVNGSSAAVNIVRIENSNYVTFYTEKAGTYEALITMK